MKGLLPLVRQSGRGSALTGWDLEGDEERRRSVGEQSECEMGAEREDVEEKTFQCSDCEKNYSFLHKLQQHQTWSCKKKEVEKIEINFTRRPLSSNVFSMVKTKRVTVH